MKQDILPFILEPAQPLSAAASADRPDDLDNSAPVTEQRDQQRKGQTLAGNGNPSTPRRTLEACSGQTDSSPGLACPLDALRIQELLCSVGRALTENFALGGGEKRYAFDGAAAAGCTSVRGNSDQQEGVPTALAVVTKEGSVDGMPNPLVSVTLRLVLMLSPSDLTGEPLFIASCHFLFFLLLYRSPLCAFAAVVTEAGCGGGVTNRY